MQSFDLYRIFYKVAELGSITRAAEQLYLTQPSVSHAIKQLEQKLATPLLIRKSKGVALTVEGKLLFEYARDAYVSLETAEKKLAGLRKLETGKVAIGTNGSLVKHYLLPHLTGFRSSYPDIRISLTHGRTADLLTRLHEGDVDLGIIHLPVTDDKLDITEALTLHNCFIASASLVRNGALPSSPIPLKELLKQPIIALSVASSSRAFLERLADDCGGSLQPAIELASFDQLIDFTRSGFGFSLVPKHFVTEELASGELVEIPLAEPIPPRKVGIATVRGAPLSHAAHAFVSLLTGDGEGKERL